MQIDVTIKAEVEMESLADTLLKAGPEAFADFWFQFDRLAEASKVDVVAYGKAMDDPQGRNRMRAFSAVFHAAQVAEFERTK